MNTEDFVTYKQALALKKLGFRERCLHYYEYSEEEPIVYENCYSGDEVLLSDLYYSFNTRNHKRFCDAPTLAQAQKWILKKKQHYVCPEWDVDKDLWTVEVKTKDEVIEVYVNRNPFFNSYEEALSAGITECLKLLNKN